MCTALCMLNAPSPAQPNALSPAVKPTYTQTHTLSLQHTDSCLQSQQHATSTTCVRPHAQSCAQACLASNCPRNFHRLYASSMLYCSVPHIPYQYHLAFPALTAASLAVHCPARHCTARCATMCLGLAFATLSGLPSMSYLLLSTALSLLRCVKVSPPATASSCSRWWCTDKRMCVEALLKELVRQAGCLPACVCACLSVHQSICQLS